MKSRDTLPDGDVLDGRRRPDRDGTNGSCAALIGHILQWHRFTSDEADRLAALAEAVDARRGDDYTHLSVLAGLVDALRDELLSHLRREQRSLFPHLLELEASLNAGHALPWAANENLARRLALLDREHQALAELSRRIRDLTGGFAVPDVACASWRALYVGLEALERDLVRQTRLETETLFARARDLVATTQDLTAPEDAWGFDPGESVG